MRVNSYLKLESEDLWVLRNTQFLISLHDGVTNFWPVSRWLVWVMLNHVIDLWDLPKLLLELQVKDQVHLVFCFLNLEVPSYTCFRPLFLSLNYFRQDSLTLSFLNCGCRSLLISDLYITVVCGLRSEISYGITLPQSLAHLHFLLRWLSWLMLFSLFIKISFIWSFVVLLELCYLWIHIFLYHHGFISLRRLAILFWRFLGFMRLSFLHKEIRLLLSHMSSHSLRRNDIDPILRQNFTSIVIFWRKIQVISKRPNLYFPNVNRIFSPYHSYIEPEVATLVMFSTEHAIQSYFCNVRGSKFLQRVLSCGKFHLIIIKKSYFDFLFFNKLHKAILIFREKIVHSNLIEVYFILVLEWNRRNTC